MGWVTLSLRKKELKRTHSYYQMRELQIAREERQMSRRYQYDQTVIQNEQQADLRDLRTQYNSQRTSKYNEMTEKRKELSNLGSDDQSARDTLNAEISQLQNDIDNYKLTYEESYNSTQTYWEDELEMIEQEANDLETTYEQEKVDVETQMESIANEIEAIDSALSTEIKNNTIKLS